VLRPANVDVEGVLEGFVSHQAVHTYLTDFRGASAPNDEVPTADKARQSINRLRGKTGAVTESNVERLRSAGEIDICEVEVFVNVEILCTECGTSVESVFVDVDPVIVLEISLLGRGGAWDRRVSNP